MEWFVSRRCAHMTGSEGVVVISGFAKRYRKAADQGNVMAQRNLGCCYENGRGAKDPAEAKNWYRKAAEQDNAKARAALERLK